MADGADFFQAQLSCKHHPLSTQVVPGLGAFIVCNGLLGGNMPPAVWGIFPGQHESTQVCQNQGIHLGVIQLLQIGRQTGGFLVSGHGIHGNVYLHPVAMGKFHRLGQLLRGKIPREGAHSKACPSQVDRVRTVKDGHF